MQNLRQWVTHPSKYQLKTILEDIISTTAQEIEQLFHHLLARILNVEVEDESLYTEALIHILRSESLKYTLLFVSQKLHLQDIRNRIYLIEYVPEYLLLPKLQLFKQNIVDLYRICSEIAQDRQQSAFQTDLVKGFINKTFKNLRGIRDTSKISESTVLTVLENVLGITVNGLSTEYIHQQCREIAYLYGIDLKQMVEEKAERMSLISVSNFNQYIFTPQKQLSDLSLVFLVFPRKQLIDSILETLEGISPQSLSTKATQTKDLIKGIMQMVGTDPDLKPRSNSIISNISNLPLSEKDKKEMWLQLTLEVDDYNFKSFCFTRYSNSGIIEEREVIEAEMLADQLQQISEENVDYVRGLLNYLFRVSFKFSVIHIIHKIQGVPRRQLQPSNLDLLEYSLESVLEKENGRM